MTSIYEEVPIKKFSDVGAFATVLLALTFYPFGCTLTAAQLVEDSSQNFPYQILTTIDSSFNAGSQNNSFTSPLANSRSLGTVVLDDAKHVLTSPLRIDATDALILSGVAAGIGGLMLVDDEIQDVFQRNRGATKNNIANALDTVGSSYVFLAGHLGLIASGFWFRENDAGDKLFRVASISLEAQLFAEATSGFVKVAAGRSRPNKERGTYSYRPFNTLSFDRSFPSGHAARAFTVAAVFADHYPQPIPFFAYSMASLIGLSRIYLDEHFSSDVVAGAALGFAIGKVLSWHHRQQKKQWMVLPILPDRGTGGGLTIQYRF